MAFDFSEMMEINIRHSTVGFVKLHPDTVSSSGSGTFVQFGSVVGILIAAHVLDQLIKPGQFGL